MSFRPAWVFLLLVGACSATPQQPTASKARASMPPTNARRPESPPVALPPEACSREGYEAFVEAFVRQPKARPSLALPGAPVGKFDIAMRDYSWVLGSHPDTLVDVDEHRSGDDVSVSARPVERNEDDEVIKVLGPTRVYTFRYVDGCWKFATIK